MGSFTVPDPPCGSAPCAEVVAHVAHAVETRDVIGMAKGILMERHGIGPDAAFERLVTMSQHGNVKLREVAAHVVDLHARPTALDPDLGTAVD